MNLLDIEYAEIDWDLFVYVTAATIIQARDWSVMHHAFNMEQWHRPYKIPVRWSLFLFVVFGLCMGFFAQSI